MGVMLLKKTALGIVLACLVVLVYYGTAQTKTNTLSMLQNVPVSIAWFYAAIPIGSTFLFFDYLLILIYGKHPFAQKQGDD